jgi:hypothetical protein
MTLPGWLDISNSRSRAANGHAVLNAQVKGIGCRRVERIMRENGIQAQCQALWSPAGNRSILCQRGQQDPWAGDNPGWAT